MPANQLLTHPVLYCTYVYMPAISTHPRHDLRTLHGANIRRLMARLDMTLQQVVEATGLDERTVRSMSQGDTRPHARTLHKLAEGLGIDTDELFQDPFSVSNVEFDRATNPQVTEVIDRHPEIFADWPDAEFAELYSRVAVGGELTEEGALAAALAMNARREVQYQVSVILETGEADILREFIGMMFRRVTNINTGDASHCG
jgi:transcriptional regulator with XRE-family HTH domain